MKPSTSCVKDQFSQVDALLNYLETKRQQTGACPSKKDWKAYSKGAISQDQEVAFKDHLVVCHECSFTVLGWDSPAKRLRQNLVAGITLLLLVVGLGLASALLMRSDHQANVSFVRLEPVGQVYRNEAPIKTVVHDPEQRLILQFNTEDLENYNNYRVELLDGASERVIWRDDTLQRQPDRSFVIDIPDRYRHGTLHLRLRGDDQILADYQLQLIEP